MSATPFNSFKSAILLLIILFYAAISLPSGYQLGVGMMSMPITIQVLFILHPLYYLGVFKPGFFPVWLAFLLGFLIDLLVGRLLGLNAFLLVMLSLMIGRQQRYLRSQPFATQWAGFFVLCFGAEGVRWGVMVLTHMTLFSPVSAMISALANAAIYPLSALFMGGVLRVLYGRSEVEKLSD